MSGFDGLFDNHIAESEFSLPESQNDVRVRAVAAERVAHLRRIMEQNRLDGYVVTLRDDFAWLTCGGRNNVMLKSEYGTAHLLITSEKQYLLAYSMDAGRVLEEDTPNQGYEPIVSLWHEGDPRDKAAMLVHGVLASDTPYPGMKTFPINRLHGKLYDVELQRSRWIGAQTDAAFKAIANVIAPGMTEREVAARFTATLEYNRISPEVIIAGSEGRTNRFYHALPTDKKIEKHLLLHSASSRWGLHANVNRLMCFGEPEDETRQAHRAAATIHANVLSAIKPDVAYKDILELEKRLYAENGYPDEWKRHFQGGETGYVTGDAELCFTDERVICNKAFDWFITVGGIQTEELSILTQNGMEIASMTGDWPQVRIETDCSSVTVPDILVV